jgi:hypothetical protein
VKRLNGSSPQYASSARPPRILRAGATENYPAQPHRSTPPACFRPRVTRSRSRSRIRHGPRRSQKVQADRGRQEVSALPVWPLCASLTYPKALANWPQARCPRYQAQEDCPGPTEPDQEEERRRPRWHDRKVPCGEGRTSRDTQGWQEGQEGVEEGEMSKEF